MKITAERQPESQVLLEIEVEPERLEKSMDQAFRRMAGRYRVPGFRPGKAPRVMFERYVGRETLMREALEKLVPEIYEEAVKEESLEPVDQPKFEIPTFEPLLIKATVPVKPTVELGDYRALRVEREDKPVTPEQLETALLDVRRRYATLQPVERPAQPGDLVRADVKAEVEGRELVSEEDADLRLTAEGLQGLPGLLEKLPGSEKGREYHFSVDVPADFEEATLAGKTAEYTVSIKEIKEEQLPEPDDEFAREVGEGFDSYAALRERIESDLRTRAAEQADREYESKVIEALITQATLEFPAVLVDREIDHILSERSGGNRASVEAALRKSGLSMEPLIEQARPVALDRVKRSLVLTDVAEREGLSVDDADVDAELDRMVGPESAQTARMREIFNNASGREMLGRTVLTRKVYARLRDIAEGKEVPPLPVSAAAAENVEGAAPAEAAPAEASAAIAASEPDAGESVAEVQRED